MTFKSGFDELPPTITREGKEYILQSRIRVPGKLPDIFKFFSNPLNLKKLTPAKLQFEVLTPEPIEMGVGTILDYKMKIYGFPVYWRTRITEWDPPVVFADLQERGPYKQWIHEHRFFDEGDTTMMQDTVRYRVRGGALVHSLVVKRDVLKIFGYRKKIFSEIFGAL